MAPPVLDAQMSPAQLAVHHMRVEGTLYKLTGDGELDEQDLEAEWQHKLETTPSWQEQVNAMTNHEKKNFLRHKRDAFVNAARRAFIRAQEKLEAQAKPEPDRLDLSEALAEFQRDRFREIDGLPRELPRLPKFPRAAKMFVQQGLSSQEYEALALAMFHQNRMHRENPDVPQVVSKHELPQIEDEAQVLARIKQERKRQYEGTEEYLLHKESLHQESLHKEARRRKKEQRKRELAAFDTSQKKFNANQKEFKSKREAFKASKEEAKEQKREALEAERQAKANGPLQEELAQQRREAKKKRKRAALEANPHAKDEREQRVFGFRYFPTEKARARAEKQLSDNEVS